MTEGLGGRGYIDEEIVAMLAKVIALYVW